MWQEMIKINNLNKYYFKGKRNELHVIDNTSLELPDVGLISILGPSGSGKTTLLNVIGGLDKATGTIQYENQAIHNSNMRKIDAYRKEHIGYIFQNYNLLHEETVYENLRIALEMVGVVDKEEVEKRIEYTLKAVGMFKFRKKQAYALSGGQQQRVAIARALVKNAKIIIADEPTGNLDNENTIEVMNILKKISKNTLVLLVTHDVKIAHFYADYIVEIKDGKILSFNKQEEAISLSTNSSNHVYLKDLYQHEEETSIGTTRVYMDQDADFKIDLDIIVRNGNIYLQSNLPIKLVESSNLKIIDDHYRDLSSKTFEDISYDSSWFSNKKRTMKDVFSSFWKVVKKSFFTFKNMNKRSKVLYFAFFCIGILLGASVICTINFATPDTSEFFYAKNEYRMISPNHTFTQDPIINIKENFEENTLVKPSVMNEEDYLIFRLNTTYHKQIQLKLNTLVLRCINEDINLLYGTYPQSENEVVIDAKNARLISNEYGVGAPLKEALGDLIELHSKEGAILEAKIVGICKSAQKTVYTTDELYTKWLNYREISLFGDYRFYETEVDANGEPLYEILSGSIEPAKIGLLGKYTNLQALVHEDNISYQRKETIGYNGRIYKIVGTYRYKPDTFNVSIDEVIINTPLTKQWKYTDDLAVSEEDYLLLSGKAPSGLRECIASVYSGYQIGDKISDKEVVGIFNGTSAALSAKSIVDLDCMILSNYKYDMIGFHVQNDFKTPANHEVISLFDYKARLVKENQVSNLKLFELLSLILMPISALFIYLIMRSKMISEIYNICVYRCLGAPRKKIIGKFIVDLVILTSLTTLIGYLIILFTYNISAKYINDLLGENMLRVNNLLFIAGLLVIYLLNLLIGILPICMLLRKTPSEICSKYDI